MAVRKNQVGEAVVVVIEILEAPSAQQASSLGDTMKRGSIFEAFVLIVAIDGKHLLIYIGDKKVLPPAIGQIGRVYSHAGAGLPVFAIRDVSGERNLLPFPLSVGAAASIHI